jgi:hypothetical protein
MTDDLESKLRDALRPAAPREDFDQRLMARIAANQGKPAARGAGLAPSRATRWFAAALAATLLLAVGLQLYRVEQQNREKGLEARREVMEALRVTNAKLDLAYRAVRDQSGAINGDPGV